MERRHIDRRQFLVKGTALGLSAPTLAMAMAGSLAKPAAASAQDTAKGGPANGGVLVVSDTPTATFLRNFNPFSSDARFPTQAGIFEPMIVYNTVTGEIVPWLATGYEWSEDSLTLRFTIRDGVAWSDGQPFSAEDVRFTFALLRDNKALVGSGVWDYLSDVTLADPKTVEFAFAKPYTPALYDIGHQTIVPRHVWEAVDDPVTFLNETPVGTGPFTEVVEFQNQVWQLDKNPTYWQEGKPKIQGMRFPAYPGAEQISLALINGDIDWAGNFIPDIEQTFVSRNPEAYRYWFPPTGNVIHLYANTTRAPFDDPNVRKAISMAINRDQVVSIAMYDYTHPADATGLSDAAEAWKSEQALEAGTWASLDPERANELLDAAGLERQGDTRVLPDGTPMKYEINVVSGWNDWVSAVQIIGQNLKEIGIEASVKTYEFAAWIDRVQQGDFDLSIGWSSQGATPFNFYRGAMSGESVEPVGTAATENWHRYANEEATALLDRFAASSDPAEQREIAAQLQMIFVDNAPAIPLFPGPQWAQFNTSRFVGFPSEENPYALPSTFSNPDRLLVLTTVEPAP